MFIELQQIYSAGNVHINLNAISSLRTTSANLGNSGELKQTFVTEIKMTNGDLLKVSNPIDAILNKLGVKNDDEV